MLIGLIAEQPDAYALLADGLRAAGHQLIVLPEGGCGAEEAQALIITSLSQALTVEATAQHEPRRYILALITPDELTTFPTGESYTDFVVAPVRVAEVAARLALHQNRIRESGFDIIRNGDLVIDVSNYTVEVRGERVALTYKEYELLKFLATHPGRVFTRESLLEQVWGYDYWGGSRTIDVHIRRIRSKLPEPMALRIETVHQVGYRYSAGKE